jgi:cyclopropane-fatty-acyl-phospholipid synthase
MVDSTSEPRVGATKHAIQHHYDVGNDFYALWLGSTMAYSCAMWREGDDLDTAQVRKFDHHIQESGADRAKRVIDIGCGWGGLLQRIVAEHRPEKIVGLTLSEAQAEWVRGLNLANVEVRVESWADYVADRPFQAAISVGAFEHFARPEFSDEEKVLAYKRFFARCQSLLDEGGILSLQTFAYGSARTRRDATFAGEGAHFLAQEIFRETDPPTLANIAEAMHGTFELVRMHNDREGYAKTCRVWLENMKARREDAIRVAGAEVYERYRKYLNYAFAGFASRNLDLYRITLRRLPTAAAPSRVGRR